MGEEGLTWIVEGGLAKSSQRQSEQACNWVTAECSCVDSQTIAEYKADIAMYHFRVQQ